MNAQDATRLIVAELATGDLDPVIGENVPLRTVLAIVTKVVEVLDHADAFDGLLMAAGRRTGQGDRPADVELAFKLGAHRVAATRPEGYTLADEALTYCAETWGTVGTARHLAEGITGPDVLPWLLAVIEELGYSDGVYRELDEQRTPAGVTREPWTATELVAMLAEPLYARVPVPELASVVRLADGAAPDDEANPDRQAVDVVTAALSTAITPTGYFTSTVTAPTPTGDTRAMWEVAQDVAIAAGELGAFLDGRRGASGAAGVLVGGSTSVVVGVGGAGGGGGSGYTASLDRLTARLATALAAWDKVERPIATTGVATPLGVDVDYSGGIPTVTRTGMADVVAIDRGYLRTLATLARAHASEEAHLGPEVENWSPEHREAIVAAELALSLGASIVHPAPDTPIDREVDHAARAGRWRNVAGIFLARIISDLDGTDPRMVARSLTLARDHDLVDSLVADYLDQHGTTRRRELVDAIHAEDVNAGTPVILALDGLTPETLTRFVHRLRYDLVEHVAQAAAYVIGKAKTDTTDAVELINSVVDLLGVVPTIEHALHHARTDGSDHDLITATIAAFDRLGITGELADYLIAPPGMLAVNRTALGIVHDHTVDFLRGLGDGHPAIRALAELRSALNRTATPGTIPAVDLSTIEWAISILDDRETLAGPMGSLSSVGRQEVAAQLRKAIDGVTYSTPDDDPSPDADLGAIVHRAREVALRARQALDNGKPNSDPDGPRLVISVESEARLRGALDAWEALTVAEAPDGTAQHPDPVEGTTDGTSVDDGVDGLAEAILATLHTSGLYASTSTARRLADLIRSYRPEPSIAVRMATSAGKLAAWADARLRSEAMPGSVDPAHEPYDAVTGITAIAEVRGVLGELFAIGWRATAPAGGDEEAVSARRVRLDVPVRRLRLHAPGHELVLIEGRAAEVDTTIRIIDLDLPAGEDVVGRVDEWRTGQEAGTSITMVVE